MTQTYRVTPTLYLGEIPGCGGVRCEEVGEAVWLIKIGKVAVLPLEAWDTAHAVLKALGLDEALIARRFSIARNPGTAASV